MKRPDGFDPTVRPREERAAPSQEPRSGRATAGSAVPTPTDGLGDGQETDVLELDVAKLRGKAAESGRAPARPASDVQASKARPSKARPSKARPSKARPSTTDPVGGASSRSDDRDTRTDAPALDEPFLSPREAARRRRRHERQEIRRFTARKRGRHRAWYLAAAIIGALVLVSLAGAYSPLMAVRTIEVVGASRVNQAEITAALGDQLGRPLALVDAGAVKAVLVGYPLIASYSLESQPPSTLVVRIVEREPVGVLQSGTVYTLVDAAGVTIERSDQPIAGYPTLMVSGGPTSKGFIAAAAVVRSLPADLRARVASVSATTADDVTLTLVDSPAEVVWGSAEDSALKARILAEAMAATDPSQVNQYDLSSPSSAIVR